MIYQGLHAFVEVFGVLHWHYMMYKYDVQIPAFLMAHVVWGVFLQGTSTDIKWCTNTKIKVFAGTRRVFRQKEKRLRTIQEKFSNKYSLHEYISALSTWVRFRNLYVCTTSSIFHNKLNCTLNLSWVWLTTENRNKNVE